MPDPREPYGQTFHEQGRLTVNAEREKPFAVTEWPDRTAEQQEIDMRGASAVAVRAVADARLELDEMRLRLIEFHAHLPAILGALRATLANAPYEAIAKPYRAALMALRGSEEEGT